jgi:hypothetical protein
MKQDIAVSCSIKNICHVLSLGWSEYRVPVHASKFLYTLKV